MVTNKVKKLQRSLQTQETTKNNIWLAVIGTR